MDSQFDTLQMDLKNNKWTKRDREGAAGTRILQMRPTLGLAEICVILSFPHLYKFQIILPSSTLS